MALGGVATGNMKANDALRVQGSMTYSGCSPMERDWGETQRKAHGTEHKSSWALTLKSIPCRHRVSSNFHAFVVLVVLGFATSLANDTVEH